MKNKILLSSFLLPTLMLGNATVANITALKGTADIKLGESLSPAKLKADLIKENNLITYDKSLAQLLFKDETIVTVGKNSDFSIKEYLDEETKKPAVELNIVKGALRAITGKIGKSNPKFFKVKTKTASIGIRGTNFIVITQENFGDVISCTHGAITVTGKDGKEYFVEQGYMARVDKNGNVLGVKPFNSDDLNVMLKNAFGENGVKDLPIRDLVVFFDYLFDDDPTNDVRENKEQEEEKKTGTVKFDDAQEGINQTVENKSTTSSSNTESTSTTNTADIANSSVASSNADSTTPNIQDTTNTNTISQTTTNTANDATTEIQSIPVENTVLTTEITNTTLTPDTVISDTTQTSSQTVVSPVVTNTTTTYSFGTANTVTIVDNTTLINFFNTSSLIIGIDSATNKFTTESLALDSRTNINFKFDTNLSTASSAYSFNGVFLEDSYTSGTKTYTVLSGSSFNTVSDLDANDNVTWGEWSIPIEVDNGTVINTEIWNGNFIAGELTPTSVISSYASSNITATYTGNVLGQAFEYVNGSLTTTGFNGTSNSLVDFGAGTVDSNLIFSVNGTNYNETLNNTINGNTFSGTGSSGAFYGADGSTLAGEFNINDSVNARQLTGVYQGKTTTLP